MQKKLLSLVSCAILSATLVVGCSSNKTDTSNGENDIKVVATEDVKKSLEDEKTIIVDARGNDVYSGWAIEGSSRGGHIPGATDFSANWLESESDNKDEYLADAIENKNLKSYENVIVYDTNGEDANKVAEYLYSNGIKNVSTYDANEWIKDESLELESYENYDMYVPADVVKDIVDGKTPENFTNSDDIKIVDVRWGNEEESGYLEGHIPSAVHINTDDFETPKVYVDNIEEWRLNDDDSLVQLALKNGITSKDCVIVTSPEPLAACRYAVILKYLGVQDVRVMSGGFDVWNEKGYELEKESVKAKAENDFGVDAPVNPDMIDTIDETKEFLKEDNYTLVDNRTWNEYIGKESGYSYHKIKGRIEGAVYGYAGKTDSSSMDYYRNADKTMRNGYEILSMWKDDCKIDLNNHLAFMCGSGWRAAEVYWDAMVMGLDNTSLYSDGWIAWSNEGNPYITGDPTK